MEEGLLCDRKIFKWIWDRIFLIKGGKFGVESFAYRLPTRMNLRNQNILAKTESVNCPLCNSATKTAKHLFMECHCSSSIWYACYDWIKTHVVTLNDLADQMELIWGFFKEKKKVRDLVLVFGCVPFGRFGREETTSFSKTRASSGRKFSKISKLYYGVGWRIFSQICVILLLMSGCLILEPF